MDNEDIHRIAWVRALCATGATYGIRVGAQLTLREVGAAVGVSPTTIQRWEQGSTRPTGPSALAYAMTLERLGARRRGAAVSHELSAAS
jgi:DNA-binding transcriptional regulator YiaG